MSSITAETGLTIANAKDIQLKNVECVSERRPSVHDGKCTGRRLAARQRKAMKGMPLCCWLSGSDLAGKSEDDQQRIILKAICRVPELRIPDFRLN